ncbi:hypothetical protein L596_011393 [Steinernema carpocapsae]|uniref:Major facilitator superfamily (MFS) profile domain-containing protein n=1 Tax=Steinernema carpocapsae TaxID=34508 RepID=A0A4U5NU92_STECR|nr:hypothetical protein L596_011393 [Steinernema carpocapsae]
MEVEEAPEVLKTPKSNLGDFQKLGWYILFLCVAHEFMTLLYLSNITFMVYAGYSPTIVGCGNAVFEGTEVDRCEQLWNAKNHSSCEVVVDTQFESINCDFQLLCDEAILVKHSTSIQMVGVMIGSMIFGQLSDLYGRRRTLLAAIFGMFLFGINSSFSSTLFSFNVTRFILMFFNGGLSSIQMVYAMEMLPKKHRLWIVTLVTTSPNYIVFAGMAYYGQNWRTLSRLTSFLAALPAFVLVFFSYETPRWLVQKGKLEEAREVLIAIDRRNGTLTQQRMDEMDDIIAKEKMLLETEKYKRRYSFIHLFYTWKLTRYILTLSFALFSASIVSYALIFNMDKLSGSIYLNSVFYGLFRYSMNILTGFVDYFGEHRTGRKVIHNTSLTYILFALGSVFVASFFQLQNDWLTRVANLTAAAMCSQLFLAAIVTTNEIFPTAVRNLAASFTAFVNRIGTVVAPFFFYTALVWTPLPYLILLVIVIIDLTAFTLVLPETKGSQMADHMPRPEERIFAKKRKTTVTTGLLEGQ